MLFRFRAVSLIKISLWLQRFSFFLMQAKYAESGEKRKGEALGGGMMPLSKRQGDKAEEVIGIVVHQFLTLSHMVYNFYFIVIFNLFVAKDEC